MTYNTSPNIYLPYKAEILFVHICIIFWNIASQDA